MERGLFIAPIALFQFLCVPGHYLGLEDGAYYVAASRSLLRGAYTLGVFPGDAPLTFLTPGWPVLLTPAAALSGDNPVGYFLWSWAWLAAADFLAWRWFRARLAPASAAAAACLFGLNPLVLSRAGVVMSEVPFLVAALGLLVLLDARRDFPGWAAGLVLGASWLIRPGALPLLPAVWGHYWFSGKKRDAAWAAAGSIALILAWTIWVKTSGGGLSEADELSMTLWSGGPASIPKIVFWNIKGLATLWGRTLLPWNSHEGVAELAAGAVAAALGAFGAVSHLRRRGYDAGMAYLAGALLMHLFWPWWYERYLIVLLPFLIFGLVFGFGSLAGRPRGAALAGLLAVLPLPSQGRVLVGNASERNLPSLHRTYAWIKAHTGPGALFASALYCRDAFYTGRPFYPMTETNPAEPNRRGLAAVLRGFNIDFVLWEGVPDLGSSMGRDFRWTRVLEGIGKELESGDFEAIFREPSRGVVVYRVKPADKNHGISR